MKHLATWAMLIITTFFHNTVSAEPQTSCRANISSRYIGGTGDVLDNRPVIQGSCNIAFSNGVFVTPWVSQSLVAPGIGTRSGNEFDVTIGWSGKISDRITLGPSLAYYDLAKPKLFHGTKGDILSPSFRLDYAIDPTLTAYVLFEHVHGMGWDLQGNIVSLGMKSAAWPIAINTRIIHNDSIGRSGNLWQLSLEKQDPFTVAGGLKVAPAVDLRIPIGSYGKEQDGISGRNATITFSMNFSW